MHIAPTRSMHILHGQITNLRITQGMQCQTYDYASNRSTSADGKAGVDHTPDEDGNGPIIVEYFGFRLNDQLLTGVFSKASFREGDEVAVLVEEGAPSQVQAVVREADATLWVSDSQEETRYGTLVLLGPVAAWYGAITSALGALALFLLIPPEDLMLAMVLMLCPTLGAALLIMLFLMIPKTAPPNAFQLLSTLGFRYPRLVALTRFSRWQLDPKRFPFTERYTYNLDAAMRVYPARPNWRKPG